MQRYSPQETKCPGLFKILCLFLLSQFKYILLVLLSFQYLLFIPLNALKEFLFNIKGIIPLKKTLLVKGVLVCICIGRRELGVEQCHLAFVKSEY